MPRFNPPGNNKQSVSAVRQPTLTDGQISINKLCILGANFVARRSGRDSRRRGLLSYIADERSVGAVALMLGLFLGYCTAFAFFVFDPIDDWKKPTAVWRLGFGLVLIPTLTFAIRYGWLIQGAHDAKGSVGRLRFEALRAQIADNRSHGNRYRRSVEWLLAKLDWLFDDVGQSYERGWQQRLFGIPGPAPIWTVRAFDRALLFAFAYPVMFLLLTWVFTDSVDPAGEALKLKSTAHLGIRLAFVTLLASSVAIIINRDRFVERVLYFFTSQLKEKNYKAYHVAKIFFLGPIYTIWFLAFVFMVGGFSIYLGIGSVILDLTMMLAFLSRRPALNGIFLMISVIFGSFIIYDGIKIFRSDVLGAIAYFFIPIFSGILINTFSKTLLSAAKKISIPLYLIITVLWILIFCFIIYRPILGLFVPSESAFLLIFGVFTLINAPFDWLALGLTRGLLRRGVQSVGWKPLAWGLLDIALSLLLMGLLAVTLVLGTQLFEAVVVSGGGIPNPSLSKELALIADSKTRNNPQLYWIFVMLAMTQLPSLANVAVGTLALLRGLPRVNRWIAAQLADGAVSHPVSHIGAALALGAQTSAAIWLAIIVYVGLFGFVFWLEPEIGERLIGGLQVLADTEWAPEFIRIAREWSS